MIIPILTGPTASGKTALALKLASDHQLEIINGDARAFYQGLAIGTAQPSAAEQALVPHHLFGFAPLNSPLEVECYREMAENLIAEIFSRGKIPLVVGGSGFYLRALTRGSYITPRRDPEFTRRLEAEKPEQLLSELAEKSPRDAQRVGYNPRRLVRAVEILRRTGLAPSELPWRPPRFTYSELIIWPPREKLRAAIKARIESQMAAGWLAEAAMAYQQYPESPVLASTPGYPELQGYLEGKVSLPGAQLQIQKRVWDLAKRQYTWFRRQENAAYLVSEGSGLREAQVWILRTLARE